MEESQLFIQDFRSMTKSTHVDDLFFPFSTVATLEISIPQKSDSSPGQDVGRALVLYKL